MPTGSHSRRALVAYLLLACTYLLYLPHVEFVLDDWLVLGRYEAARESGAAAQARMALAIVQNRFHNQFRFQWLSFSIAYLLFLVVGYSPKIVFVVFLLLHVACAAVLRRVLEGLGAGLAFLSGAVFLLLPSTHQALFWSHNCSYYLWSTFWFLLYLHSLQTSLLAGRLDGRAAARQALFLLLALFSGDPVFCLLPAGAPLLAWFWRSKGGLRATLLAWGTVGAAAAVYALLINRAPIVASGVGLRYDFSFGNLRSNLFHILDTYRRLSGLAEGSFYRLWPTPPALAMAAAAAAIALYGLRGDREERWPAGRTLLLAAGLWAAAYGPIWFLRGHEFRYDYVPSPYLALGLSAAVLSWRQARALLGAALLALVAAATIADIEQCWIPQSRHLRALAQALRSLEPLQPRDLIVVANAPLWIGTAPHFALQAEWASTPFAEHVTGVRGLETAVEIVQEAGRLRVFHYDHVRDFRPDDAARTRILVEDAGGRFTGRRLLAEEIRPGAYRLYPLKGYAGPPISAQDFTREQLAFQESDIYFAKPFTHHQHQH